MTDPEPPIWYDGAMREHREALGRIERDALAFLERAAADFERDDAPWLLLLDDLAVPFGLDDPADYDYATIPHAYSIEVTADLVLVRLSDRLPRQLEATFAALGKKPWCLAPRLQKGSIEMRVQGLDPAVVVRLEKRFVSQARAARALLDRGVATLVSLAAPSTLPRVTEALEDAARKVAAIAAAKVERVRSAGDRS